MKLYDYKAAPNPRRVRVYLHEKGIEVDTEQVDLRERKQLDAEFKALNPQCVVPFLILDDGTGIGESMAICRYFEETRPDPPLFGATPTEKAVIEMWNRRMEFDGLLAAAEAFRNSTPGFKGRALSGPVNYEQSPQLAERGIARTKHFLELLDTRLADNRFVAGNDYSVADITAMISIDFAGWQKIRPADDQVHLERWYEEVSGRPSAKA